MMKKFVVLIEDQVINMMLVKHVAENLQVPLQTFSTATAALEAEYRDEVALVLLDCNLPDWTKDIDELIGLLRQKINLNNENSVLIKSYTADIGKYLDKNFDGNVKKLGNIELLKQEFSNL